MYNNSVPTRFLAPILQNVQKSQYRPLNAGIPGGKVGQLEVAHSLQKIRMVVTTDESVKDMFINKTEVKLLVCRFLSCTK